VRADRSPRWTTTSMQLAAEALAGVDRAAAMVRLERAVDEVLVDVDWMALCPSLAPLRGDARFAPLRARVEGRAADVRAA
jgi:eukaryotic-like serine/threonine-protein kinase